MVQFGLPGGTRTLGPVCQRGGGGSQDLLLPRCPRPRGVQPAMVMPGSCAGEGGGSGGRQRLLIGLLGVEACYKGLSLLGSLGGGGGFTSLPLVFGVREFHFKIGTAGVVYTSVLGVKSYDYGKIN
jgi:hypothetical protein